MMSNSNIQVQPYAVESNNSGFKVKYDTLKIEHARPKSSSNKKAMRVAPMSITQ